MLLLLAHAFANPLFEAPRFPPAEFSGKHPVEVDLLRVVEGGPRIYVQGTFADGSRGLFLVDTGADISVLRRETAERIGLELDEDGGEVVGLGGVSKTARAVLPRLSFGTGDTAVVTGIQLAVDVPGFQEYAGAMPLDGLLGNNVWSRFVLELDYPADLMVLHPPDSVKLKPKKTGEMRFDGYHVFSPILLRSKSDPETVHQVTLRVDTGAGELSFCGRGLGIAESWTSGLEAVLGLGASSSLPFYRNLRMTRRIQLDEVRLGNQVIAGIDSARWMNFDGSGVCPDDLVGLAGHHLLQGHRVFFDYGNDKLQLGKSKRRARQLNGHRVMLEQTGNNPWLRARLHLGLGEMEPAIEQLRAAQDREVHADEARALLAAALLEKGDLEGYWSTLQSLSPEALVDEKEIVASVNGLLFREQRDDAFKLAQAAIDARPDDPEGWVALSDAHLWDGKPDAAHDAIQRAIGAEKHPDALLLRRARIAYAQGDRHASLAHVRKLLQLYPMGGEAIWFYAEMIDTDAGRETFLADLNKAMGRLHPRARPLDFLVAAHARVGDATRAGELMEEGIARDCDESEGVSQDNCLAWYWSLAGVRPDPALARIERALADGDRADFLDTLAMVRLARGELREAHEAALAAARRAPDNVYMLWQAARLGRLAEEN